MWGFTVRGSWRPNITEIFWPQTYGRHVVYFLFFDAQPEVQRPLCWVMAFFTASYPHLLRTSTHQGPKAPSAWCGFPYHISSKTPSDLQLNWQLHSDSNSTELYNGSTPTRSPTRSLKSHVWSLSSGNNHIYQPLRSSRIWYKIIFFKWSLAGLNSEYSFS